MRIGLTGRMGSGKGEVVKFLEQAGYRYISLSDIVREEMARAKKELDRSQMQDFANNLRKTSGAGILGRRVREKIEASGHGCWVIDGIRNPAEVMELRKLAGFFLVGIDARTEIILARLRSRRRSTDHADEAELKKRLSREWGVGEPDDGQQVGRCMAMADFTIDNDESLDELQEATKRLLAVLSAKRQT